MVKTLSRPMTTGKIVLDNLLDSKTPLTAKEAGGDPVILGRLERSGRVVRAGFAKAEGRGRPSIKWTINPKLRRKLRDQKRRATKKANRKAVTEEITA